MSAVLSYIQNFVDKYLTIPDIYASDIVEIIVIAVLIYYIILWFKKSRAWILLRGILVLVLFMVVASVFHLTTLLWIIDKTLSAGIIALVIIFQPELRRALEELGKKNVLFNVFKLGNTLENERFSDKSVEEITRATLEMAKAKTGALMVITQEHDLGQYIETGIRLDAKITSQLLINIFEKNTPLHDGAVIVRGDRVVSATCYLPLSDSMTLSKDLGTRHRAAVGISEVSDSLTIVVSEETGKVSIAMRGQIYRNVNADFLRGKLKYLQNRNQQVTKLRLLKRRFMNGKKDSENLGE